MSGGVGSQMTGAAAGVSGTNDGSTSGAAATGVAVSGSSVGAVVGSVVSVAVGAAAGATAAGASVGTDGVVGAGAHPATINAMMITIGQLALLCIVCLLTFYTVVPPKSVHLFHDTLSAPFTKSPVFRLPYCD
jgi:hypothetical protein